MLAKILLIFFFTVIKFILDDNEYLLMTIFLRTTVPETNPLSSNDCVCVYIFLCKHTDIYIFKFIHACIHYWPKVWDHIDVCRHMYLLMCVCVCVCVYIHVWIHTCVCVYIYIYIHTHKLIHIYKLLAKKFGATLVFADIMYLNIYI